MGIETAKSLHDAEAERRQRADELASEAGPHWSEAFKPGSLGCHELLDRTAMVAAIAQEYVLDHPSCIQNPEWYALAEQAVSALNELYQRVGAQHLDDEHHTDSNDVGPAK